MRRSDKVSVLLCASCALVGCSERESSTQKIERATYNVYYLKDGDDKSQLVGKIRGLQNCAFLAHEYASGRGQKTDDGWTYICCMKTATSECAEKHR